MNKNNIFGFILFLTGNLTALYAMDARQISVDTVNYALAGKQGAQEIITFIKEANGMPAIRALDKFELFFFLRT